MKTYGIGIIGYGAFGRFLHHSWKKSDRLKVAAVFSKMPIREDLDGVTICEDWRQMLSDPSIDLVSIATPPSSHGELACAALQAGKHVLIEKPMATGMEEGNRILAACRASGRMATVNFMMRFNPIVEALGALSREGAMGELCRADVENYAQDSALPLDHWFWDRSLSGGILIEHAVHFIDLVNSLTSQKHSAVTGFCHFRNDIQQDQVMASVLYDRGLMATHYHSFASPGFFESTSIRLAFDCAVIDLEGWIPLKGRIRALVNEETKRALGRLPGFTVMNSCAIDEAHDDSRPEGWGEVGGGPASKNRIFSHGREYRVEEMITGTIDIGSSKAQVYQASVLALMEDLIASIESQGRSPRVSLEEALADLDIASRATSYAEKAGGR
jgi:predicted dehydrogenase